MYDELDLYIDEPDPFDGQQEAEKEKKEPDIPRVEAAAALRSWLEEVEQEESGSGSGVESVFEKSAGNSEALSSQEGSIGRLSGFTDATLVRWFDSRGGSLEKTKKALRRHLLWRRENRIWETSKESVAKELSSDFIVFGGPDTDDYPCVFAFVRNHDKDSANHEEMQRLILYLLEEALRKCDESRRKLGDERKYADQFTLVFDLWGFRPRNMNYDAISTLVQTARYNYPHVIRKVLIVNTPWIFKACYTIIEGFLPEDARKIVGFANNYDEMSAFIALENLPDLTVFAREDDSEEEKGEESS
jgi:hypothetical protein